MSIHEELEELLAEFKREEAVFIYQSDLIVMLELSKL